MAKYGMVFNGEKANVIYSVDLCRSLSAYFAINITLVQLNEMIPTLCQKLGMSYDSMVNVDGTNHPMLEMYRITLW